MEFVVRALRNGVASSVSITGTSPNQSLSLMVVEDVGRSTGSNNSTTINDTAKSWTTNQWQNYYVQVFSGTGSVSVWKQISSNTATQLTISGTWSTVPDNTSEYRILSDNSFARSGNTLQYTKNGSTSDLTANITEITASQSGTRVDITLSAQTTNTRQDTGATGTITLQSKVTLRD